MAANRWEGHRERGTPLPFVDEAGDALATRAEAIVAEYLGCEWADDLGGADPGWDMVHRGWRVDVKQCDGDDRLLLVKRWKPITDIYALVHDGKPDGWEWGSVMKRMPIVYFGYRHDKVDGSRHKRYCECDGCDPDESYARDRKVLRPMHLLANIMEKG